jgi:aspartate dehydrogenase family protein
LISDVLLETRESILGYLAGGLYGEREHWADIAAVVLAMEKLRLSPGYDISPSGTAREAAAGFPANVNVAAALAMAGIGPYRTMGNLGRPFGRPQLPYRRGRQRSRVARQRKGGTTRHLCGRTVNPTVAACD